MTPTRIKTSSLTMSLKARMPMKILSLCMRIPILTTQTRMMTLSLTMSLNTWMPISNVYDSSQMQRLTHTTYVPPSSRCLRIAFC